MSTTATVTSTKVNAPATLIRSESSDASRKPKRRKSGAVIALRKQIDLTSLETEDIASGNTTSEQHEKAPRRQSYKLASSFVDEIEMPVSSECFVDESLDDSEHPDLHGKNSPAEASFGLWAYIHLLHQYPMYRAYLVSHFCQNLGDWFVRIASLLLVQEFSNTGKTIAHLTISVLLPKAIFSQLGGAIADRFDRRVSMILIDCLSGVVVLGYLLAIAEKSLNIMYAVTILRSILGATYYPITTGMVPLLVPDAHDLQLAVTLNSFAWSITSIIGGLVAGAITSHIGFATCYWIDSITFFISAAWMYWGISGSFTVYTSAKAQEAEPECKLCGNQSKGNVLSNAIDNFVQVAKYLWICGFGLLVFQKSSASFVWGIEDIVGAKYTTVFRDDGSEQEGLSSWHIGCLFSVIGAGCMVGPALITLITDARRPHTLQRACWIAYCLLTLGWLLISRAQTFHLFLAFTFIRTMGSGIAWVNSTLLLQTLVDPSLLGRVLAVDYTLTTLLEASSASMSGTLYDRGYSKEELALFGAFLGILMVVWWGVYYWVIKGAAANPRFSMVQVKTSEDKATESKGGQPTCCCKQVGVELEVPEIA